MKTVWKSVLLAAALATLLALTAAPAALASCGGYAAGILSYTCPFMEAPASSSFILHQLDPAFDGSGTAYLSAADLAVTARIAFANVDAANHAAYFAGPVVKARPRSLNSAWWFFAVHAGSYPGSGAAIGEFTTRKMALRLVAARDDLTSIGGGFQPLLSGWAWVD